MGNNDLLNWTDSTFAKLLKIRYPLIQAPMAGNATTAEFVAAASNAGALGSLGAGYLAPDELRKLIVKTRALSDKPFAVNLFVPKSGSTTLRQMEEAQACVEHACRELRIKIKAVTPPYVPSFEEQMSVVLQEKIPVFSFTFGIPAESWLAKFKENGVILMGTATTLPEAQALAKQGVDIIVAQGSEAGGHRGTFLGTADEALNPLAELLPQLIANIHLPIVAAGGIMDGRGILSALARGAIGVQMGTAFLSSPESGINMKYKEALLNLKSDKTVLTRVFSGKLARGIKNKFIERMQDHESVILDYPIQHALTREMRKEADKQNNIEFMSLWAGQHAFKSEGLPVGELIEKLNQEVRELSKHLAY